MSHASVRLTAPPKSRPELPPERIHGTAQHRDHRACRPRQDDPGRPAAAAVRHLPREPAGSRAGDGQQRPRARARDHHPRQMHLGGLEGCPDQHRRHAGPRRFRRRGRAHPVHGRQLPPAGRRGRGADAADQVRARQGLAQRAAADRGDQQGGQARAALDRGPERDLRPVRRTRCRRAPARLPAHLRQCEARLGGARARRPARGPGTAVRPDRRAGGAAGGRQGRAVPDAGDHAGGQPLSRPPAHRPDRIGPGPGQHGGQVDDPRRPADRAGADLEDPGLSRPRSAAGRGGRGGRHRGDRGLHQGHRRRHAVRACGRGGDPRPADRPLDHRHDLLGQ